MTSGSSASFARTLSLATLAACLGGAVFLLSAHLDNWLVTRLSAKCDCGWICSEDGVSNFYSPEAPLAVFLAIVLLFCILAARVTIRDASISKFLVAGLIAYCALTLAWYSLLWLEGGLSMCPEPRYYAILLPAFLIAFGAFGALKSRHT